MSSDVPAASAAEAVLQSVLLQPFALNATFSLTGVSGPAPSQARPPSPPLRPPRARGQGRRESRAAAAAPARAAPARAKRQSALERQRPWGRWLTSRARGQAEWDDQFVKLEGPELWRQGIGSIPVSACRDWLTVPSSRPARPREHTRVQTTVTKTARHALCGCCRVSV